MPIRLQPQSFGARLGGGLGDAAVEIGDMMMKQGSSQLSNQRISQRELLKDAIDKVTAGTWEPDVAEAALTKQGVPVPKGYFQSLQPSVSQGLEKIIGGINKADTFQSVEGPTALASEQAVRRSPVKLGKFDSPSVPFEGDVPMPEITPPEGFHSTDDDTPEMTLGSSQFQPTNPAFNNLLNIRNEKLNSFAPKEVQGVDANGVKNTQFVNSRPDQLTGRSFQAEPTGAQAGRQASNKALSEAIGNNEGGLPQLKGQAFTTQENAERGAKVQTAADTTRATTQAGLDVTTLNPANVQAEARKAAAIADATQRAKDIAERSGIPPEIANAFTNTTATGRSWAFIPPEIPAQERRVAIDTLVRPSAANPNGIKLVSKDQAAALQAIDKARADYDNLMTRMQSSLAKSAGGRPLSALTNTIGTYMQTNPELTAAVATDFPLVLQNLKANAGSVGRIMQIEVAKMSNSIPLPTDTWRVAQLKKLAMGQAFQTVEDSILGRQVKK